MNVNRGATVLVVLLVAASTIGLAAGAGAAGAATTQSGDGTSSTSADGEAYAGTHVDFAVDGDAIANYTIDGEEAFSSVSVQSQSDAGADAGLGADISLETMTDLNGAGLSLAAQTETSAQVEAESGATLSAHDNQRGSLVVRSGGESQYVQAELGADATAEQDGDTVRVETGSNEGVFLVVGDGEVTVNDEGDVTAELASDAALTFRSYEDGERDEDAEYEESLIADGTAAAEVHVEDRDGETAKSAVAYGEDISAEVSQAAESQVEMTVERAHGEGTVVITTVSEEAVGSLEDIDVTVDGEAAVEASSKSELEAATQNADSSHYMVAQQAEAQGEATVYIAFNHFSERTATIDGSDDGGSTDDGSSDDETDSSDGTDDESDTSTTDSETQEETDTTDSDDETTDEETGESESDSGGSGDSLPGFGVGVATIALSIAGLLARLQD
ncbi:PGF-CTERM sorting domain-containing protein [Halopiger aswanensis]|uniref:PGF-CTERM protein n=1 Tax=Halopiger aswanensis TaxID=148449 RepID=A0A3R7E276_9EURY|nr:PGF-CTERM sorting domain-containing protein [Halopiger aswanensis]RKD98359.1 PGF-CTERM protein [Halopiger aswanensis]